MVSVQFTQNLQRHVACGEREVDGATVREVLDAYFAGNAQARGYVVDDQGALRHHMMIFVDGRPLADRRELSDAVRPDSTIHVLQALSGG
jgi:hypothetical protein